MRRPGLAVVVVSYNTRDELVTCLASLRADGVDEVVVVDNSSADGSAEAARAADPAARVLALDRNLGFGSAANVGVAACSSPYVAVCNPDLTVGPGTAAALVEALERDPGLGAVGPRIDTPDGRLYESVRRFPGLVDAVGHAFLSFVWPRNRFTRRYKMVDWDHGQRADVDWVAGTYVALRREAFDAVGGFDDRYFMYMEDVDLCWRLWRAGWRVGYEPTARVVHAIGRSTDQTPYRMIAEHHRSLGRYFARTATGPVRLLLPLVRVALVLRTGMAWAQRLKRRKPHAAP